MLFNFAFLKIFFCVDEWSTLSPPNESITSQHCSFAEHFKQMINGKLKTLYM